MMEPIAPMISGLAISVGWGTAITPIFLWLLRRVYMKLPKQNLDPGTRAVPALLLGILERIFFTVVIAYNVAGGGIAMIGWLTVKMAANWNRSVTAENSQDLTQKIRYAMAALAAGIVSMGFALIGGLVWKGDIPSHAWMVFWVVLDSVAR